MEEGRREMNKQMHKRKKTGERDGESEQGPLLSSPCN